MSSMLISNTTNADMYIFWNYPKNGEWIERSTKLLPREMQTINFINDDDKKYFLASVEGLEANNRLMLGKQDDKSMNEANKKMEEAQKKSKQKINKEAQAQLSTALESVTNGAIKISETKREEV